MTEKPPIRVFDELTEKQSILIALCASPVLFLFVFLGDPGRGRAAGICAFGLILCAKIFWSLRRHLSFWLALAVMTICHVPLIMLIPWTDKSYPGIVLLPFALPDFGIVYGVFKLVEKAASRSLQADGAVDLLPK